MLLSARRVDMLSGSASPASSGKVISMVLTPTVASKGPRRAAPSFACLTRDKDRERSLAAAGRWPRRGGMARSPQERRRHASSLIGLDRLPALSGGLRLTGEERGEIETVSAQPRRLVAKVLSGRRHVCRRASP